jgi:23S rRNA (adenine2503-C2)-methyltransferase
MGLVRNLSCAEILAQIVYGVAKAKDSGFPVVRNVVYMGMGEPLDNLEAVGKSLEILCDDLGLGFGARHITVSTVGTHERAIQVASQWPVRLAWSLHAADDTVRRSLIATAKSSVLEIRDWFMKNMGKRPLFVECVLIDGINDRPSDLQQCIDLFADVPNEIRINLLPLNLIGRPELRPSPIDRVMMFRDALIKAGHFCAIRRSRGEKERAACGQLAVLPR